MKVSELMDPAGVRLYANIKEAADVLGILVELQEETGAITNGTAYYNAVCQRENFGGTTAIGDGIALPHACNAGVSAPSISALTLRHGVDWGAPDVRAVDLLFMIAVPPANFSTAGQPAQPQLAGGRFAPRQQPGTLCGADRQDRECLLC